MNRIRDGPVKCLWREKRWITHCVIVIKLRLTNAIKKRHSLVFFLYIRLRLLTRQNENVFMTLSKKLRRLFIRAEIKLGPPQWARRNTSECDYDLKNNCLTRDVLKDCLRFFIVRFWWFFFGFFRWWVRELWKTGDLRSVLPLLFWHIRDLPCRSGLL